MSAVNPLGAPAFDAQNDSKSGEPKSSEPSMEEILASIRRIIAEDQQAPFSSRPLGPTLRAEASPGVFDLRPAQTEHPASGSSDPPRDELPTSGPMRVGFADRQPVGEAVARGSRFAAFPSVGDGAVAADQGQINAAEPAQDPMLSAIGEEVGEETRPAPRSAADEGLDGLCSVETSAAVSSSFNALTASLLVQGLPSIEDLAREMLRPMLKAWLDDNLPTIVERLVRAEIERVARGGR